MADLVFIDCEVNQENKKVCDLGALYDTGEEFHSSDLNGFKKFIADAHFICGHNIVHHDCIYLENYLPENAIIIDTLYLSPLVIP